MQLEKMTKLLGFMEDLESGKKIILNNPLQYKLDTVHSIIYYDDGSCVSVKGNIIPKVGVQIARITTIPKSRFVEVTEIYKSSNDDYFVKTVENRYYPLTCNINHLLYLINDGYTTIDTAVEVEEEEVEVNA